MNKKPLSVTGLANIGRLMARGLPKRDKRRTQTDIAEKTAHKIMAAGVKDENAIGTAIHRFVEAAVREAYNLGHADAVTQTDAVEALLTKQYAARTKLTLPTAVAAIMEQVGMSAMVLDLDAVATVFDRVHLDYEVHTATDVAPVDTVTYTLHHLADDKVPQ